MFRDFRGWTLKKGEFLTSPFFYLFYFLFEPNIYIYTPRITHHPCNPPLSPRYLNPLFDPLFYPIFTITFTRKIECEFIWQYNFAALHSIHSPSYIYFYIFMYCIENCGGVAISNPSSIVTFFQPPSFLFPIPFTPLSSNHFTSNPPKFFHQKKKKKETLCSLFYLFRFDYFILWMNNKKKK